MNTLTGIIAFCGANKYTIIDRIAMNAFKLNLGTGRKWRFGIDPASRFTGIALVDDKEDIVILLDCKRDTILTKEEFYDDLYRLLLRLAHGQEVKRVVNEKPFVKGGFVRASEVLVALRGKIEEWSRTIPEFAASEFIQIPPSTWKSHVIDKSKGKGRFNAVGAVAEDLCDRFPLLQNYKDLGISGDLDSFDALGAVIGYEDYAYDENGNKRISGTKEKTHTSLCCFVWEDTEKLDGKYISDLLGKAAMVITPKYLDYNTAYSFSDNVAMATTNDDAIMTLIPKDQLQPFQWKFGIDISDEDKSLLMIAYRKGHFSVGELNLITSRFTMMEEYSG